MANKDIVDGDLFVDPTHAVIQYVLVLLLGAWVYRDSLFGGTGTRGAAPASTSTSTASVEPTVDKLGYQTAALAADNE